MKTISDYTIYCTEEQTKKALELGAPIQEHGRYHADLEPNIVLTEDRTWLEVPTAEQMINWLRRKHKVFCNVVDEYSHGTERSIYYIEVDKGHNNIFRSRRK